jgi:hypothetical protein
LSNSSTSALPASVNVRLSVGGREVQWTLRDMDEARLAAWLDALLARYPVPEAPAAREPSTPPTPETPEGWCPIHQVQMTRQANARGSWGSHPSGDGWCRGKRKKGA